MRMCGASLPADSSTPVRPHYASRLLGLRNLLHPMRSMDAASNSATRPMGEPHSFGKCGTRTSVQVVGQALKPRRNEREYRP